jgi:hypothetical protein
MLLKVCGEDRRGYKCWSEAESTLETQETVRNEKRLVSRYTDLVVLFLD